MGMKDCFPDWLRRRSGQLYGPDITPYEAYPIYQVQPAIISSENSNTQRAGQENAFYQYTAGTISAVNTPLRIVHVQPNAVFDCVSVLAFDDHVPSADATNIPVPIFFSWDRPSRIQTEVLMAGSRDAFLATALAFASANVSDIPTAVFLASPFANINNAVYYNSVTVEAPRTNRPFYVWFNDGIAQKPTGNAVFKIQWFTRGR